MLFNPGVLFNRGVLPRAGLTLNPAVLQTGPLLTTVRVLRSKEAVPRTADQAVAQAEAAALTLVRALLPAEAAAPTAVLAALPAEVAPQVAAAVHTVVHRAVVVDLL